MQVLWILIIVIVSQAKEKRREGRKIPSQHPDFSKFHGAYTCRATYVWCDEDKLKRKLCDEEQHLDELDIEGLPNPKRRMEELSKYLEEAVKSLGESVKNMLPSEIRGLYEGAKDAVEGAKEGIEEMKDSDSS